MGILKKVLVYLILTVLLILLVFPYMVIADYYLSDISMEIRNQSGKPVDITIKLIEIEHDNEESNYKAHLEHGERVAYKVRRGIKVMKYNTQYTEDILDFCIERASKQSFVITNNNKLETYF